MTKTIKRIISDIVDMEKNPVEGIYIKYDKTNIYKMRALIIGPIDSPFHYGNYFFEINFPKDYPNNPPHVIFKTINNDIRFHPNLYANGKVCLSILNTWSGPGWTSACTLKGILSTIQSILNQNPIINEPGFERI
jgi:ubiquitin-conjugating enzyme E2 Z